MKPKIIEVITKILEGISKGISIEELNRDLLNQKVYDKQTLSIAFSLLYDKILLNKKDNRKSKEKNSIRFLSNDEIDIIGTDNYNYLLHIKNLGLIDTDSLNYILEQLTVLPIIKLSRKEINWMILASLVDFDSEFPPGSRMHLYSSDSVN